MITEESAWYAAGYTGKVFGVLRSAAAGLEPLVDRPMNAATAARLERIYGEILDELAVAEAEHHRWIAIARELSGDA